MATTILVVDDSAILRDLMSAALRGAGYDVLQAASGAAALQTFHAQTVDLLVLDIGMPEMDGLTMLKHLRGMESGRAIPVILLTAQEDRETILKAAALGVRDYLLKSTFCLKELLSRVHLRLATANSASAPTSIPAPVASEQKPAGTKAVDLASSLPAPPRTSHVPTNDQTKLVLLTRDQTRERLVEITASRTCAGVVAQVITLANSPDSDIAELVQVIESDPIIASRVLQLANSSTFRQKYSRLSSVDEAVRKVGIRTIQNTVVSIGVFQAFPPDSKDGFNTMRAWQHCFAVSAIVRALMQERNEDEREHAALVGLCHDLGEIVLRQHFSAEYDQILNHAIQTGQPAGNVESIALSMRHGELVNEVLTRIGLPPNISIPIMRFHEGGVSGAGESLQIVRMLQIANVLAHGMMLVPSSETMLAPIMRADLKRACGNDAVTLDLDALRREVLTSTNLLARLPANDEARFVAPLYPQRDISVWYARHSGFAELDPLGEALGLMANVRSELRLPQGAVELENTDLIVAASPSAESPPALMHEIRAMQNGGGYRNQPIVLLLGNSSGGATIPHTSTLTLPVSLKALAEIIEKAAVAPRVAV